MKDIIKVNRIDIDKVNIVPIATIKEGNNIVIEMNLIKDSKPFSATGQSIKLGAILPSGARQEQSSGFVISGSNLKITVLNSMVSEVGKVEFDLTFTDSEGFMTSGSFFINVTRKTLNREAVESMGYLESVDKLILDFKSDYEGLRRVIIDENVSANLKVEIDSVKNDTLYNIGEKYNKELTNGGIPTSVNTSTTFRKRTFGRKENAVCLSAISNNNNDPEVLGTTAQGLSKYHNRDSVAFYAQNSLPSILKISNCIYTNTSLASDEIQGMEIPVGSILDTESGHVGIVSKISNNVIFCEDGFYKVVPGVGSSAPSVPTGWCKINNINKVWSINNNVFIDHGLPAGVGQELGVFTKHSNINDVGGLDVINFEETSHYGIKSRSLSNPFLRGFVSENNDNAFVSKNTKSNLLESIDINDNVLFKITKSGKLSKVYTEFKVLSDFYKIGVNDKTVLATKDIKIDLSDVEAGREITVLSTANFVVIANYRIGGVVTKTQRSNEVGLSLNTGEKLSSYTVYSDGNTCYCV